MQLSLSFGSRTAQARVSLNDALRLYWKYLLPITAVPTVIFSAVGLIGSIWVYQKLYQQWPTLITQTVTPNGASSSGGGASTTQENAAFAALKQTDLIAASIIDQAFTRLVQDFLNNQLALNFSNAWQSMYGTGSTSPSTSPSTNGSAQQELEKTLRDQSRAIATQLKDSFTAINSSQHHYSWVTDYLIPAGLFFANVYIIVGIWLFPTLVSIWAVLFLLPPQLEFSNSLKKGGFVVIGFLLYPILLHPIIGFAYSLSDASDKLDATLDPTGSMATGLIYAFIPNIAPSSTTVGAAINLGGKPFMAANVAQWLKDNDFGLVSIIAWLIILSVLISSPMIVAKWMMGTGASETLTQPAQSSTATGGNMVIRGVIGGALQGGADIAAGGTKLVTTATSMYNRQK